MKDDQKTPVPDLPLPPNDPPAAPERDPRGGWRPPPVTPAPGGPVPIPYPVFPK